LVLCTGAALADDPAPLRLDGVMPRPDLRLFVTDNWGTFDVMLTNPSDSDRRARVVLFYVDRPNEQYSRDVWVPAHATIQSWLLAGPAPAEDSSPFRRLEVLLYDVTDGQERLIPPRGEERIRKGGANYHKREPFTAVLIDDPLTHERVFGQLPQPETRVEEVRGFAVLFRSARHLSQDVRAITTRALPPTAQGLDGIDHVIVATETLSHNPAGLRALRHWLQGGGHMWIMLDQIADPEALAPLLGDALDFQIVDRVFLTDVQMKTDGTVLTPMPPHEKPVKFVRVLLPPQETVRHTVQGWPAWFTRDVGRGKVVFTTLGPRGWSRKREQRDGSSPYPSYPDLPVPTNEMQLMAEEVHPSPAEEPFRADALRPLLEPEIGYSVVGRHWVLIIFGVFLAAAVALGVVLRKSRRPEWAGWLAPLAALGTAGVFLALGESARRAVPPTVAVVQVVESNSGSEEAAVHGLLAVYRPDSGLSPVGAEQGGFFDLDMAGAGGTRRFMLTDQDSWHWDNLALPAGVRLASFHDTVSTPEPIRAVAHFGPDGLEGRLMTGSFHGLSDVLLATPHGRDLAVHVQPDGTFRTGSRDILPEGQFLADAVLSDRQQRRQAFYRATLKRPKDERIEGRHTLFAWADPIDLHFTLAPEARTVGSAFLIMPLRLEHSAPEKRVTIPGPLLRFQRVMDAGLVRPHVSFTQPADQELRFQLPAAVLPLQVERARLLLKIDAPGRHVTVAGRNGKATSVLHEADSPLDPIQLEITRKELLQLDAGGGLHLDLKVGGAGRTDKWTIEYLELEVAGIAQ
jgi:hypothetical protein